MSDGAAAERIALSVVVRRAEQADASAVKAIARACALPVLHAEEIGRPLSIVLIAEDEASPCGFAALQCVADESELFAIAVDPEMRRRGIARALLNEAIKAAQSRGAASMFLEVRASNAGARAFYSVEGFEETGTRRNYYSDGEDAVLMRRIIR